jgi:hypothetical protein
METTSPAGSKCATTGGREAKPKAPKKLPSKEEKDIEAAKRRGKRRNMKERKDATAATQQAQVVAEMA